MSEYGLKAQILVELLPYVQLPTESERSDRAFQIVVLGRSPFGSQLDDYARSRTIHRRPIRIRYLTRVAEAEDCDAIFICRSEMDRADGILAWARARHILTLSDDEALALRGAMVNLLMEGRFVRLAVNQDEAASAGVFLGSQLLRNARMLAPKSRAAAKSRNPVTAVPASSPASAEAP